jgi:chitinase
MCTLDKDCFSNICFTEKCSIAGLTNSNYMCGKRIVGYFPSWGTTTFTNRQFAPLDYAIFAFLETFPDGRIDFGSADSTSSKSRLDDQRVTMRRWNQFSALCAEFGLVRCMFAVGGWENSQYFSSIAADPNKRAVFIRSIINLIDRLGVWGVDIDWEYPVTGGAHEGLAADKQNYVTLIKELRTALDTKDGSHYYISIAGAAGQWTLDPGYDLPNLLKYIDFVNVMTYDYFGAWGSKWGAYTGPPSPLYFGSPKGFSGKVNADWTLKYYVCRGKMPHKINMGLPMYGRYWENVGEPIDGVDGMWRLATSVNGQFVGGYVPWKDIKSQWLTDPDNIVTFHEKSKAVYSFNQKTRKFLGFENDVSLRYKVKYAEDHNLGGLMIW